LYGVPIIGTVLPGFGCNPAAKKSPESGGPTVIGVKPIAGVAKFPFTKLVAVTVAKPDKLEVPGQVPRATAGPPVNVIQFARVVAVHIANKIASAKIVRSLNIVVFLMWG
jgi:hypothetical protein